MQVECFRADSEYTSTPHHSLNFRDLSDGLLVITAPYEKDGVMVGFKATGKQGGSFTLDPKTRYIRIKHALG